MMLLWSRRPVVATTCRSGSARFPDLAVASSSSATGCSAAASAIPSPSPDPKYSRTKGTVSSRYSIWSLPVSVSTTCARSTRAASRAAAASAAASRAAAASAAASASASCARMAGSCSRRSRNASMRSDTRAGRVHTGVWSSVSAASRTAGGIFGGRGMRGGKRRGAGATDRPIVVLGAPCPGADALKRPTRGRRRLANTTTMDATPGTPRTAAPDNPRAKDDFEDDPPCLGEDDPPCLGQILAERVGVVARSALATTVDVALRLWTLLCAVAAVARRWARDAARDALDDGAPRVTKTVLILDAEPGAPCEYSMRKGKGFDPETWEADVREHRTGLAGKDFRVEVRYLFEGRKYRMVLRPGDRCRLPSPRRAHGAGAGTESSCRMPRGVLSASLQGPPGSGHRCDVTRRVLKYQGPDGDFHAGAGLRVRVHDMFPFDDHVANAAEYRHLRLIDTLAKVHDVPYADNPFLPPMNRAAAAAAN